MAEEQVSAADTDGLEQEVTAEYEEAEVGLLTIVAAAIAAELAASAVGGAIARATGLALLRQQARSFVRDVSTRGAAAATRALERAREVGRAKARRLLRRRGVDPVDPAAAPGNAGGTGGSAGPAAAPGGSAGAPGSSGGGNTPGGGGTSGGGPAGNGGAPGGGSSPGPGGNGPAPGPNAPDLAALRATAPRGPRTARGVTIRTPDALIPQLTAMAPQLLASAEGLYNDVMTQVLAAPVDSEADRLRLAQRILNRTAAKGITGFTDKAGRRWSMVSYVEMATRTAAAQTAIDAHCTLIAEHGYDLVRVSVHQNCSPMCAPFQGHLLSVTGANTSGGPEPWRRRVITSLADARMRGFNHPNCKHFVTLWVPGDDLPAAPEVDPGDYKAEQQLRALERRLRASRRMKAVALDDDAKKAANRRIRAYRAQIKSHVAAHPTVLRKRHRERIGAL